MLQGYHRQITSAGSVRPLLALLSGLAMLLYLLDVSQAQVTQSGLGTSVAPNGSVYEIRGGTRSADNLNLFHSFGEFSLGAVESAKFFNTPVAPTTSNIFGRVTGGMPSTILGTIDSATEFPGANLWLLNPAGIMFGAGASLNVGGSAHFSTADYLLLRDDVGNARLFNSGTQATDLMAWSFTSAPVEAFGFLGPNFAAIEVQGSSLSVPTGQALSLVGGDVTMTGGSLTAPGGQINLASVTSPGEVGVSGWQLPSSVNGGTVTLSGGATVDVSGDGAATVVIRGGQLMMDSAVIAAGYTGAVDNVAANAVDINVQGDVTIRNGGVFLVSSAATGGAGDVQITGQNIQIEDGSAILLITGDAVGSNLSITAPQVSFTGGSGIVSDSSGMGSGGTIAIAAANSFSVSGGSSIFTNASGDGNGGSVTIAAGSTLLADQGFIQTGASGAGPAGDITVQGGVLNATSGGSIQSGGGIASSGTVTINADVVSLSGQFDPFSPSRIENLGGSGPTGDVIITARQFLLQDGAKISTESPGQQGGNIAIEATEAVSISSGGRVSIGVQNVAGGSVSISAPMIALDGGIVETPTGGTGTAGSVALNAGTLTLANGSVIRSDTTQGLANGGAVMGTASDSISLSGGSTIRSNSVQGGGNAGAISLIAGNSVSLSGIGTGLFSETQGAGTGGAIAVHGNQVQLNNEATISAKSSGTGPAGNISIGKDAPVDALVMQQSSSITTESAESGGGGIEIQARRLVQLTGSSITTSVHGGGGDAGNITIDPQAVIVEGSQILAQAFGGNGGNISIAAGVFFADPTSTISASSTLGVSGTVDIQAPVTNLSGTLAPLPAEIVQAAGLLQARCAARLAGGTSGSFVVAGRDGLPLEPGGMLPSPLYAESPGSGRLAGSLDIPGLRVGRTFVESNVTLAPLASGCSS